MVQRLELYASTTRGMGSISGWGTQILHAMWCSRKKKKKEKKNTRERTLKLISWREDKVN